MHRHPGVVEQSGKRSFAHRFYQGDHEPLLFEKALSLPSFSSAGAVRIARVGATKTAVDADGDWLRRIHGLGDGGGDDRGFLTMTLYGRIIKKHNT